jgi:hypothetical protein
VANISTVGQFAGQNWLITPAAVAANQAQSRDIHDQNWILVLSGVGYLNWQGSDGKDWHRETVTILPDIPSPLQFAINQYKIPVPTYPGLTLAPQFNLNPNNGWVPFVAVSSFMEIGGPADFEPFRAPLTVVGYAVDDWRPTPFGHTKNYATGEPVAVDNIFNGVDVDLALKDSENETMIYRVSYNFTLVGQIVFTPQQIMN